MKIASIADIHLRGKDLDDCSRQLHAAGDIIVRRNIQTVILAGDVFDNFGRIGDNHASDGAVADVFLGWVAQLTRLGTVIHAVSGNHDSSGAGGVSALRAACSHQGFMLADEVEWSIIVGQTRESVYGLFVPWQWSGNAESVILDAMAAKPEADRHILVHHCEIIGRRMNGATTCEAKRHGWQVGSGFIESLGFNHVIGGHFHKRQPGYTGALRQLNFGEGGNPAGFEIWDSELGAVEWVELDAAPRYRTIIVKPGDEVPVVEPDANTITRVRFETPEVDSVAVRALEMKGVRCEQVIDRQQRVRRADVAPGILADHHELIKLWAKHQTPAIEPSRVSRMLRAYDHVFAKAQ